MIGMNKVTNFVGLNWFGEQRWQSRAFIVYC